MRRESSVLLACCLAIVLSTTAHAQVTLLGNYQLGEDDVGAVIGGGGNLTTTDIAGPADNLTRSGTPLYAANSVAGIGSLSMNFNPGSDAYSRPALPTGTNNFVIQGWVTRDTGNAGTGIYNGDGGANGAGIIFHDNGHANNPTWHGLFGGVLFNDTLVPAVAGLPTHLAVVRDNGTTNVYVNGVVKLTTNTPPNAPGSNFSIGNLDGRVDQVSVGIFAPGAFNPATHLNFPSSTTSSFVQLYNNGFEAGDVGKYTLSGNVGVALPAGYGIGATTQGTQMLAFNGGQSIHNGVMTTSVIQGAAGVPTYVYFDWGNFSNGANNPQNLLVEVLDANTNAILYSQTLDDSLGANTTALFSPWFLNFVPTVGNFRLRFTDSGGIAADSSDGLLDNIRVAQQFMVPEPTSIALWSIGALLVVSLTCCRGRRR